MVNPSKRVMSTVQMYFRSQIRLLTRVTYLPVREIHIFPVFASTTTENQPSSFPVLFEATVWLQKCNRSAATVKHEIGKSYNPVGASNYTCTLFPPSRSSVFIGVNVRPPPFAANPLKPAVAQ